MQGQQGQQGQQGGQNNQGKYKTMLCKHSDTSKGCVYKDKCQFAHGAHELKQGSQGMGGGNVSLI